MKSPAYKRVLVKLSGESLKGSRDAGIDPDIADYLTDQLVEAHETGVQMAFVIGGGNFLRGNEHASIGMRRDTADYAGMLATIINGIFIQNALVKKGIDVRTQSAISIATVAEDFIPRRAERHMEKRRLTIFVGGTGNPYMTTDTAAALRALEIEADILLMAKNGVDGVYNTDPKLDKNAVRFEKMTYQDFLSRRIKIMDTTAASLCMDNRLDVRVFNIFEKGNLRRLVEGEEIGTLIYNED